MTFSIEEAFRFGWQKTKEHSALLFKVLLTLFAIQVAYAMVGRVLEGSTFGIVASLALGIASYVVGVGLTVIVLKIAQGKHVEYDDILQPIEILWKYALANLLAGVLIFVGFLLLVIPGIYLATRLSMVRFAILDGEGITGSLERSGKLTHGVKWRILAFLFLIGLINILGALLFLVGLLVTIPVTMIAYAHIYQKLKSHHSKS